MSNIIGIDYRNSGTSTSFRSIDSFDIYNITNSSLLRRENLKFYRELTSNEVKEIHDKILKEEQDLQQKIEFAEYQRLKKKYESKINNLK